MPREKTPPKLTVQQKEKQKKTKREEKKEEIIWKTETEIYKTLQTEIETIEEEVATPERERKNYKELFVSKKFLVYNPEKKKVSL
jgi:hypothetical protein